MGDVAVAVVELNETFLNFFVVVPSAKDKGEKKLFGFAFTPLMREDGTTLSDENHELYVYKVRADVVVIQTLPPAVASPWLHRALTGRVGTH